MCPLSSSCSLGPAARRPTYTATRDDGLLHVGDRVEEGGHPRSAQDPTTDAPELDRICAPSSVRVACTPLRCPTRVYFRCRGHTARCGAVSQRCCSRTDEWLRVSQRVKGTCAQQHLPSLRLWNRNTSCSKDFHNCVFLRSLILTRSGGTAPNARLHRRDGVWWVWVGWWG